MVTPGSNLELAKYHVNHVLNKKKNMADPDDRPH